MKFSFAVRMFLLLLPELTVCLGSYFLIDVILGIDAFALSGVRYGEALEFKFVLSSDCIGAGNYKNRFSPSRRKSRGQCSMEKLV
jgi:hypothetical protein